MSARRTRRAIFALFTIVGVALGCDDGVTTSSSGSSTGDTASTSSSTSTSSSMGGAGSSSASTGDTTSSVATTSSTSTGSSSSTGGSVGKSASDLVSSGYAMQSGSYSLHFTLGQPTVHQSNLSSPNYQLHGGLVGATESDP